MVMVRVLFRFGLRLRLGLALGLRLGFEELGPRLHNLGASVRLHLILTFIFKNSDFYALLQSLREKQKTVRENHGPSIKQMKMWNVSIGSFLLKRLPCTIII